MNGKQIKIPPKPNMSDSDWDDFLKSYFAINKEEIAKKIIEKIKEINLYIISDINKKESKKNPYPPFITSTLQVEASKQLRYRPRRTMMLAQQLYEGIELGSEGLTGLITYMRTDSVRLSEDIVNDARGFIKENFGENYLPEKLRQFESKKEKCTGCT